MRPWYCGVRRDTDFGIWERYEASVYATAHYYGRYGAAETWRRAFWPPPGTSPSEGSRTSWVHGFAKSRRDCRELAPEESRASQYDARTGGR